MLHGRNSCQQSPTSLVIARYADVMETIIGKAPGAMALGAACLRIEDDESPFGSLRNGIFLSSYPTVERCLVRDHRPFKGGWIGKVSVSVL